MHQLQTTLTADIKIEHVNRIDHEQETAVKNMSKKLCFIPQVLSVPTRMNIW